MNKNALRFPHLSLQTALESGLFEKSCLDELQGLQQLHENLFWVVHHH